VVVGNRVGCLMCKFSPTRSRLGLGRGRLPGGKADIILYWHRVDPRTTRVYRGAVSYPALDMTRPPPLSLNDELGLRFS